MQAGHDGILLSMSRVIAISAVCLAVLSCAVPPEPAPGPLHLIDAKFGVWESSVAGSLDLRETFEIPRVPGVTIGWLLFFEGQDRVVRWRERFTLSSAPANTGGALQVEPNVLVRNGTTRLVGGSFGQTWTLDSGDPIGRQTIEVYVDGVLVKTFTFFVRASVGAPSPLPPTRGRSEPSCFPHAQCCKVCSAGQACGNTCISSSYTCHVGRGCACNTEEICR